MSQVEEAKQAKNRTVIAVNTRKGREKLRQSGNGAKIVAGEGTAGGGH